jgi:hypothetical protein
MPFGLENAGATYQRAMEEIFHEMLHTIMEDYMDDILVKSIKREDNLTNLEKVFDRLEQYNLRLNQKNCVFRVTFGKLLGYIVSRRGIEV